MPNWCSVTSVTNAIKQLPALGVNTAEIITDNGYYSEHNFAELLLAGFDFITLAKTSIKWIRPEIDKQMEALDDFRSLCPAAQEKARKYFTLKKRGNKVTVVADNKAIREANKYHGYFVLVSNKERDPFECLRKYRKRETIESFFEAEKRSKQLQYHKKQTLINAFLKHNKKMFENIWHYLHP